MVEQSWWFRAAVVAIFFSAVVYLVGALSRFWGFLGDLLLIFFFGWLVGSLLIHTVNSLMRIPHMRRPLAIALVYLGLLTLVLDIVFLVAPTTGKQLSALAQDQVPQLVGNIPVLLGRADGFFQNLGVNVSLSDRINVEALNNFGTAVASWFTQADNAISLFQHAAVALMSIGLVIGISFYLVLDGGKRMHEALKVLPPRWEKETWFILDTVDQTFHGYVRGMLVVSAIYGVGTASVMAATGLPAAFPTAILSSVLLMVPFVGDWLALITPLTIAILAGDFVTFLIVLSVLLFVQQVMLHLLTPKILGHAVRMPAIFVLVSVVLGARLAGPAGALLGVPTIGVIYSLSVHYGTIIRQRREEREAVEREHRAAATAEAERAAFSEEVERALHSHEESRPHRQAS